MVVAVEPGETVVGKYVIGTAIGKGTYGQVFKGMNASTGEPVALKRVQYNPTDDYLNIFFREIGLLRALRFYSILSLEDVVVGSPKCVWIVTPLYDCDLRTFVRIHSSSDSTKSLRGPLLRRIMYQIVAGVNYCHGMHVLHRDLKPHNVLVDTQTLRVKVADFGLARSVVARHFVRDDAVVPMTHEIVTLWYRAPEVILAAPVYDESIDIWSLGVMLYELYSGSNPFNGKSEVGTLIKIFSLIGTPTVANCSIASTCRHFSPIYPQWSTEAALFRITQKISPEESYSFLPALILDCIRIDPIQRITAKALLHHHWFNGLSDSVFTDAVANNAEPET